MPSPWKRISTKLYRYVPKGSYYLLAKVDGVAKKISLGTCKINEARAAASEMHAKIVSGKSARSTRTVSELIEEWQGRVRSNPKLSARAKDYKLECLELLLATWPALPKAQIGGVTIADIEGWRGLARTKAKTRLGTGYSATRVNGALTVIRELFRLAEAKGWIDLSPARRVENETVTVTPPAMPTKENFAKLRAAVLDRSPAGIDMFDLLAASGARVDSARHLTWGNVDFGSNRIHFATAKRGGYHAPLNPTLKALLEGFRARLRHPPKPSRKILKIKSIKRVLASACAEVGLPQWTHHDLRHWFATRCIESGVDLPTVAAWLGHRDGGQLVSRVYGHLRDEHSQAEAAKVNL